ncbi:hypothetical protein OCH239_18885 [Roseivivax halodurans JCM 10272]|uniref:histidine kinase n=1 Tax=Roseivivax halodurans JCM 10272 TaxID=1449350 RepID=X7E7E5_9RHOB|nr:ATP-binding protein [Roseivivax halodurans]ETX11969.1 hypothetical protein OCH239_18885 [Roseivivax halodurans JCM 10272]
MAQTITSLSLTAADDVKVLQQITKAVAEALSFKQFHATRLVTCALELARNVIEHGGGGYARLSLHEPRGGAVMLRVAFADQGPGIGDLDQVLATGGARSIGHGLGLGLAGVRSMADEFHVDTGATGTRIHADFAAPIETPDLARVAEHAGNRCDEILMRESNADRRIRQLESDLNARELTIGEVHHRTANNLTMIASLIRMEQRRAKGEETRDVLASLGIRVDSMARTHKLLQDGSGETVAPGAYLQQITALAETFNRADLQVAVDIDSDDQPIPARLALDLGLITGELVTNAFKHAFPDRSEGRISIQIVSQNDTILYRFSDNGIGLPEGEQPERSGSLGWRLIRSTVSSNLGHMTVKTKTGLSIEMSFPRFA